MLCIPLNIVGSYIRIYTHSLNMYTYAATYILRVNIIYIQIAMYIIHTYILHCIAALLFNFHKPCSVINLISVIKIHTVQQNVLESMTIYLRTYSYVLHIHMILLKILSLPNLPFLSCLINSSFWGY